MDKIILNQVDELEVMEQELNVIIDEEVAKIDINAIMKNPKEELARVAENVKKIYLEKHVDKALELGFDFGREIEKRIAKDKDIEVDKSKDSTLNAES